MPRIRIKTVIPYVYLKNLVSSFIKHQSIKAEEESLLITSMQTMYAKFIGLDYAFAVHIQPNQVLLYQGQFMPMFRANLVFFS